MPKPKKSKRPIELPTRAEINRMLSVGGNGFLALRNRAALILMWRAGLRRSEVSTLVPRDIDMHRLTINVRFGKGEQQRVVGMDVQTASVLQVWKSYRDQKMPALGGDAPLFCTTKGRSVHPGYWWKVLRSYARRADVTKRMHPHVLRHAFTVELIEEGKSLEYVRRLLGHASLITLTEYTVGLGLPAVLDAVRKREW